VHNGGNAYLSKQYHDFLNVWHWLIIDALSASGKYGDCRGVMIQQWEECAALSDPDQIRTDSETCREMEVNSDARVLLPGLDFVLELNIE
jgi:hypothetical protein